MTFPICISCNSTHVCLSVVNLPITLRLKTEGRRRVRMKVGITTCEFEPPSSTYDFRLHLWYLQSFLHKKVSIDDVCVYYYTLPYPNNNIITSCQYYNVRTTIFNSFVHFIIYPFLL